MFGRNLVFCSVFLLAAFSSVAVCDDSFGLRLTTEKTKENTQYSFHYFVKDDKTGDYKTQKETREGDSVHGSYTLAEPNGDLRTVTYKAGPGTGFEAKVDVQSSASPMKTTEATINPLRTTKAEKSTAMESNVSHFPGGFQMDISSKPESDVKTEMGMKFSLKTTPVTEPVTGSTKAVAESKATETPETTTEASQTIYDEMTTENFEISEVENSTLPPEGREISEDPIEKEIDEAINSMPKLPELILSDNKTHFKFHKDPEEALLDERITQIARQLAETSLRREYEERKLGHFIPISLSGIEPRTTTHLSKSFKFMANGAPSSPSTLNVLARVRLVPQYIYRQTLIPGIPNRLPAVSKPIQKTEQWEQKTYESITNPPDILKVTNPPDIQKVTNPSDILKFTDPSDILKITDPSDIQKITNPPDIQKVTNPSDMQKVTHPSDILKITNLPDTQKVTQPSDILKLTKSDLNKISKVKEKKFSTSYKTTEGPPTPVIPIHVPTFFQFFTPYVMNTPGSYAPLKKSEPQYGITVKSLGKGVTPGTTLYTPVTVVNDMITEKS